MSELDDIARELAAVSPAWASVVASPVRDVLRADLPHRSVGLRRGVEAIREGWLLHRGAPRVVDGADADLSLLIGDWAYAAGLVDVAEHGTPDDVATLAELVAEVSARSEQSIEQLEPVWQRAFRTLDAAPS